MVAIDVLLIIRKDTSLLYYLQQQKMNVNPPGLRRNINSLTQQERKRYFWCVKMLAILPPFDYPSTRSFLSLGTRGTKYIPYNMVNPKCLHDLLIASYTTCCADPQIQKNLFGLYHRHLIIYYEIMLNYADDVLQKPFRHIQDNYPSLITPDNAVLWKDVLAEYQQVSNMEKVMAHYWNPTNYDDQSDILPPKELVYPEFYFDQREPDSMDNLFKQIRGHYPWQISPKKRWYNDEGIYAVEKPRLVKQLLAKGYLYASDFEYSSEESQVVEGQIDARSNFTTYYQNYISLSDIASPGIIPHSFKKNMYKSFVSLMDNSEDGNVVTTFPHSYNELFINLGAKRSASGMNKEGQYFSSEEIDEEADISIQQNKLFYNNSLAHFQLGYALYNHDFKDFVRFLGPKNGQPFDLSSDFVNNLHYTMIDGPYNASNLLFFPYHSWVDAQLQLNIRRNRIDPVNTSQPRPADTMGSFLSTYNANGYMLKEYYNSDPSKSVDIGINIIAYCLKKVPLYQSNNDNRYEIRPSTDLQQIYQSYRVQNQKIQQKYPNFKDYNFNYDYELREVVVYNDADVEVKKFLMGDRQSTYIPKYLRRMGSQVTIYKQFIQKLIKNNDWNSKLGFLNDIVQRGYVFDVVYMPTLAGSVPQNQLSGTIKFDLDMVGVIQKLKDIGIELTPEQIMKAQKLKFYKEIDVFQAAASAQMNSRREYKMKPLQGSALFWCETAEPTNKKLVYHSKQQQPEYLSDDCIRITSREQMSGQKSLIELQGAQKVKFFIIMDTQRKAAQDFTIEVIAEVTQTSAMNRTKLIKKEINIKHLSKVVSAQSKGQSIYTFDLQAQNSIDKDKFIYTSISARIKVEHDTAELFRFKVRKYHKLAHYCLRIAEKQGDLSATVEQIPRTTLINQYLSSTAA